VNAEARDVFERRRDRAGEDRDANMKNAGQAGK
jgi:hypothetical protein